VPGVVVRIYSETPAIIPVLRTSSCRDISCSRDRRNHGSPMMNAMVCHIAEGLRIEQEGRLLRPKKNFV